MKNKVIVEYKFQNKIDQEFKDIGVLFSNGMVMVADASGEVSLYTAYPSQNEGCVMVDLDDDGQDLLSEQPELLVNLIIQ
ncbi:hypothetical protein ACFVRR_00875 [Gottfriedia sp. NPDC057948]|uniref:hypothetical protein n=1 Tax=Gottfriedia sp. NPDC057948 TaxID=3346287 RepID=UPI0036D9FB7C